MCSFSVNSSFHFLPHLHSRPASMLVQKKSSIVIVFQILEKYPHEQNRKSLQNICLRFTMILKVSSWTLDEGTRNILSWDLNIKVLFWNSRKSMSNRAKNHVWIREPPLILGFFFFFLKQFSNLQNHILWALKIKVAWVEKEISSSHGMNVIR